MMPTLLESKLTAWCAMALVVTLIVLSFCLHTPWWGFIAIFFLFLGVFSHIAALYLRKVNGRSASKLETCALVFLILAIAGFIVEYIVYNYAFDL